ncbi:MAG: NADH-quinone oxidoreductase subunit H [Desulfurococcaceae archaeon]
MDIYLQGILTSLLTVSTIIVSILLDGVERKIKAAIQSRIGPPITQTLYDVIKLFIKDIKPVHTVSYILLYYVSFLTTILSSIYLALLYSYSGELLTLVISITLYSVSLTAFTIIPLLIPNPFSYIGGMREVLLAIVNESSIIIGFSLYAVISTSIIPGPSPTILKALLVTSWLIAILISSYALTGRPPFDIAEAEPEIASGILVELSGPILAAYMLFNLLKRFASKLLVGILLVGLCIGFGYLSMVLSLITCILLWIVYSVIGALMGRSRIDIAPLTLAKVYIGVYTLSITVLLVMLYA